MKNYKLHAAISYFFIFGIIVSIALNSEKRNAFVALHIKQAIIVSAFILCINFMNLQLQSNDVLIISWGFSILLKTIGIYFALNNQEKHIPIITKYANKWFKDL
jgi:uncharacterized membrane protein